MSPQSFLITAVLLGAFVFCGGGYAACYTIGALQERRTYRAIAFSFYLLQCLTVLAIAFGTPLAVAWKLLIIASTAAYAIVPTITLRYLRRLHTG